MERDAAFRGNATAKIDDKGRFKIPAVYRHVFAAQPTRDVFVTSEWGDHVRIYPLAAWIEIEKRLQAAPSMSEEIERYIRNVNFWGSMAELDTQDRVLIHPRLRERAATIGDVEVVGSLTYLAVWDGARFAKSMEEEPYTRHDKQQIKDLKI